MSLYINLTEQQQDLPVYRIISKSRLFELFNNRKITLVHPSLWEDPYENFILKSKVKLSSGEIKDYTFHEDFYGQCWSLHKASDAMWRIYSKDCDAVRIKTTVRKLLGSLYNGGSNKPSMSCIVGKVQYLSEKSLKRFANSIYVNGELTKENLFRSLLVKRLAFKHESEIRLLYFDLDRKVKGDFYFFDIQPDELIEQIMVDPRCTYNEFEDFKTEILEKTSFSGPIKRSLLYTAPENIELNDNPS